MTLPSIRQSPVDPAFVQDPYPFYDQVRALGPLVYWEDYEMPVTAGFAEVNHLLRDRRLGREIPDPPETPPHLQAFQAMEAHSMLALEPPRHTRLRGLVVRAFTSRQVGAMAAEIETLCHDLIDQFPKDTVDLLPTYCTQVPVIVIARLLGVPEERAPDLLHWSNTMVAMYQARRSEAVEIAANTAAHEFSVFLQDLVRDRRRNRADDLISELIAAEQDGAQLTAEELIATCVLLLNAGHEATVHTMGNGIAALSAKTGNLDWRDSMETTVEEVLRYDPPLHMFTRYAYEKTEIFEHVLQRGEQVGMLLGGANRDPDAFEVPNRFDPHRALRPNVSLGAGLHFCVGAPLARLELKIALRILFERMPKIQLSAPPRYANLYHFHGLEQLEVTL